MAMDPTKNGVAGRITVIASLVGILVVLLGGVYNLSNTISGINDRLDRNLNEITRLQDEANNGQGKICVALKQLSTDIRLHAFAENDEKLPPFPAVDC